MSYSVERMPIATHLGRETETGVQEVRFDVSGWLKKWPGMSLMLMVRTPGGNVYPANTALEGAELVWRVSDADTAEPGMGGLEIVGELDGVRKVSATTATRILPRLQGTVGDAPGPAQVWVDKVLDAARKAAEQAVKDSLPEDYTQLSEDVGSLKDEMDALHPLEITVFSVSPALAEKGSRVTAQTFAYGVNRTGASITLEGEAVSGGSTNRSDVLTQDRTYTLRASLNGAQKTATAKVAFVAPVYYGVRADCELTSGTVLALTRVLTTSRARNFTVNAGEGQYILYALPVTLGVPTFKVGGFEGGFMMLGELDFTNASGHTEPYRLYRSTNANLGATTVAVS